MHWPIVLIAFQNKISTTFHRPSVLIAHDALWSVDSIMAEWIIFVFYHFCGLSHHFQHGGTRAYKKLELERRRAVREDLKRYVLQNLSRREILDFVYRDYAQYAWSLGTLTPSAGD